MWVRPSIRMSLIDRNYDASLSIDWRRPLMEVRG